MHIVHVPSIWRLAIQEEMLPVEELITDLIYALVKQNCSIFFVYLLALSTQSAWHLAVFCSFSIMNCSNTDVVKGLAFSLMEFIIVPRELSANFENSIPNIQRNWELAETDFANLTVRRDITRALLETHYQRLKYASVLRLRRITHR